MKISRCLVAGLLPLGLSSALLGCEPTRQADPVATDPVARAAPKDVVTQVRRQGNVSVTTATDTGRLGRLLHLRRFRPVWVQYRYTFIDNSGGLVPGPSDHQLEAVLWFDSLTFRQLRRQVYAQAEYPSPGLLPEQFNFAWLPPAVRAELLASRPDYQGDPDLVFGTNGGKVWLLDGKLLLQDASN